MAKKQSTRRKKKYYYHVTDVKNVKKILAKGLKGTTKPRNRGETLACSTIFVLSSSDEDFAASIARKQIWPCQDIDAYAVIKIESKGITGPIVEDICGEMTTEDWQWMVQQPLISPEFLSLDRIHEEFFPGKAVWDLTQSITVTRKWTQQEWEMAIKYIWPDLVLNRLYIELRKARSPKAFDLLAFVEESYSAEQIAPYRPYLKEFRKELESKFPKNANPNVRKKK